MNGRDAGYDFEKAREMNGCKQLYIFSLQLFNPETFPEDTSSVQSGMKNGCGTNF